MVDLSTTCMGIPLRSPLVAGASPLSRSLDQIRRMEDAGAGAVVLHSLFEEQIGPKPGEVNPYARKTPAERYLLAAAEFSFGPGIEIDPLSSALFRRRFHASNVR